MAQKSSNYFKQQDISEPFGFFVPNSTQLGISNGYAENVGFDEASKYIDPNLESLEMFSAFPMSRIVPGGSYQFGDGTVSAPSIGFQTDSDTGFYHSAAGEIDVTINGVKEAAFNSSGLLISDMTPGSVLFAGVGGQVTQDNLNFFWDDTNNRLGINTAASPTVALDVNGDIRDRNMTGGSVLFAGSTGIISQDNASFFWNDTSNFLKLESSLGKQIRLQYDSTTWSDFTVDINGNLYSTLTTGPQWIFKAFSPLFNITGTATNQTVTFRLVDNDTTLKSQFYYDGGAAAGSKASILQNYGGDYLQFQSNGSIRFTDKFASTEYVRFYGTGDVSFGTGSFYWDNTNLIQSTKTAVSPGGIDLRGRTAAADGMPNAGDASVIGDGWMRIYGHTANEFMDFSYYKFGSTITVRNLRGSAGAECALEVHGWNGTQATAIVTFVRAVNAIPDYCDIQIRNPTDTDGLDLVHYASGPEIYPITATTFKLGVATTPYIELGTNAMNIASAGVLSWLNGIVKSGTATTATIDTSLSRIAAGTLGLKPASGSAQFNVYNGSLFTSMTHDGTNGVISTSSGKQVFTPSSGLSIFGAAIVDVNRGIEISYSSAGGTVGSAFLNSDNTNAASHTRMRLSTGGSVAGDPSILFTVTGATNWSMGVDNSDSDNFKIDATSSVGGQPAITITASGQSVVLNSAALATNTTSGFLYIAGCAGTPVGVPVAFTGRFPDVYDSTNDVWYRYNTFWRSPVGQEQANGQQLGWKSVTELTTIAAAATTDTTIQIPVDAVVLGVTVRVTTAIPTAATFTVTGTTSGTQFDVAGGVAVAANTTDVGTRNVPYKNGAAQTIRITPNISPAANTGRVRVTIHYFKPTPATS